jgi:alkyl hydroperoxide reductase subunit AhpC
MSLRLGDIAPDFEQDSSQGRIQFHAWLGTSWGVLFSHPADFTPVCTTELGLTAKLAKEFEQRNVKTMALSTPRRRTTSGSRTSTRRKRPASVFRFLRTVIVRCRDSMT